MRGDQLLYRKGAIPVLVGLSGTQYAIVELAEESVVTRNTVRQRLIDMEEAGWARTVEPGDDDDKRQRIYELTPEGEMLAAHFDEIGTTGLVERYQEAAKDYEKHLEDIRDGEYPIEVAPEP